MHVLVIDDEQSARVGMQFLLTTFGMSMHSASNIREAMGVAETRFPDVVIADLNLGSESGMEAIRQIRRLGLPQQLPAILVTGESSLGRIKDLDEDIKVIHKPVDAQLLEQTLLKFSHSGATHFDNQHI